MLKARSVVAGVMAAGALVVGGGASASANLLWCMDDPPVQVSTPEGTNLTVHVTVAVPKGQGKYLNDVKVQSATTSDGAGGTLITLHVTVPATISAARLTAGVNQYSATDSATVAGGSTAILHLDVPAA